MHRATLAVTVSALLAASAVCTTGPAAPFPVFPRWYGSTPLPDRSLLAWPSPWRVPVTEESLEWLSVLPTWPRMQASAVNGSVFPFVDEVVAVRVLGGWDQRYGHGNASDDVIDANYNFRWDLLDARLDPWVIASNVSVMVVLDNVPYVFTDGHPVLGPFGQDAPPADPNKWRWFVVKLMQHFVERYGATYVAERMRIRVGTEPDGPRYGNSTQYFAAYAASARAVKSVSPRTPVGAGNWLAPGTGERPGQQFELDFYKWCHDAKVPVDFIGQSDYPTGLRWPGGRRYPSFIANGSASMRTYAEVYGDPSLPREIMEFAPLLNRARHSSTEPGSFGASFYVACWATALSSGVSRVFHWGTMHEFGRPGSALWTAYGWAMAMAETLVGGAVRTLVAPVSRVEPSSSNDIDRGVYAIGTDNVTLVTAYDPYRDAPAAVMDYAVPHATLCAYRFNATMSPFDQMLAQATALNYTALHDGLPYGMRGLLNPSGQRWVREPAVWASFLALQNATFTPSPLHLSAGESLPIPLFNTLLLMGPGSEYASLCER